MDDLATGAIWVLLVVIAFAFGRIAYNLVVPYAENEIKYVMRGGGMHDAFMKVKDKSINAEGRVFRSTPDTERTSMRNRLSPFQELFGYFGPLWPWERIHTYEFTWNSWRKESEEGTPGLAELIDKERKKSVSGGEGHALQQMIRHHRTEFVDSLYYSHVYPFLALSIELKDCKIDVLIKGTATVLDVRMPIFGMKGEWFLSLESGIQGVIADYCGDFTALEFITLKKAGLEKKVQEYLDSQVLSTGILFSDVKYQAFEICYDPGGKVQRALQQKAIADAKAYSTRTAADATAYAARAAGDARAYTVSAVGLATAGALKQKLDVVSANPNDRTAIEQMEMLAHSHIQTLAGGGIIPTLPLPGAKRKKKESESR